MNSTPNTFPLITRRKISTVQVNITATCNQACLHCHIESSPKRTEGMNKATIDLLLEKIFEADIETVDITGGAPEMNEHFRFFVSALRAKNIRVIDRCNLTILTEPGYKTLAQFLADEGVELVCSLPCYTSENVDKQRGNGTFSKSIEGLHILNEHGYGKADTNLILNLMYNPSGASLPPAQEKLEADYKKRLLQDFGIVFNRLYCLTNMPIKRFDTWLKRHDKYESYMQLLKENYNEKTLENVMCRDQISVRWDGYLYDCDFNLALDLPLAGKQTHLSEVSFKHKYPTEIAVAKHCFGCSAGCGSSCGGVIA